MLNRLTYIILLIVFVFQSFALAQSAYSNNLAHTFSIVARDTASGELGVAVQTHWFAVGSRVSWAEAGVGAIATQSFTNVSFGPRGLAMLKEGLSAQEALDKLIESDEGRDLRQVGIIDSKGNTAAWTGKKCIKDAGHVSGENFSVQANLMLNDKVWPAMAETFQTIKGPLAERLIAALQAGQAAGGDIRGKQSAALVVVKGEDSDKPWEGRVIDLRVDDHRNPIQELKRLLKVKRAYQHMTNGDEAIEAKDVSKATTEYGKAMRMVPDNLEMKYWYAVSLANAGLVEEAIPLFKKIFKKDSNWWTLTRRLPASDLLKVSESDLQEILSQK